VTAPPNAGGERDQLGLWLRVVLGLGIGLYFGLGERWMWLAAISSMKVNHCEFVGDLGRLFDLFPNEFVDLIDLPEVNAEVCIKLDSPRWLLRDGLLVISLWLGSDRIYSVAFILSKEDGRRVAYVGGIQGRRSAKSLELNRILTKAANAMRPPDFLFEFFRSLCEQIGVELIRGASDRNRHQRSAYFQQRAGFCRSGAVRS
jgi:hypothetical protein